MDIILGLKATLAGAILGGIFYKLKLPLPAPPVFAGIMGILGVLIGSKIVGLIF